MSERIFIFYFEKYSHSSHLPSRGDEENPLWVEEMTKNFFFFQYGMLILFTSIAVEIVNFWCDYELKVLSKGVSYSPKKYYKENKFQENPGIIFWSNIFLKKIIMQVNHPLILPRSAFRVVLTNLYVWNI